MRKITSILLLVIAFIATAKTTVVWENMGNDKDAKGNAYYVQRFTVKGDVAKIDSMPQTRWWRLCRDTIISPVPNLAQLPIVW